SANLIAIEDLFIDFHAGLQKEIAGEFLDRKADRFRGAGKSPEPSGLTPSASGRRLLCLAPGGKQLSRGTVVELSHLRLSLPRIRLRRMHSSYICHVSRS